MYQTTWRHVPEDSNLHSHRRGHRGNVSAEPLGSNNRGIFTETLPSSDRGNTQTDRQKRVLISPLYFFKITKVDLIKGEH
jgi:hypothetical protein